MSCSLQYFGDVHYTGCTWLSVETEATTSRGRYFTTVTNEEERQCEHNTPSYPVVDISRNSRSPLSRDIDIDDNNCRRSLTTSEKFFIKEQETRMVSRRLHWPRRSPERTPSEGNRSLVWTVIKLFAGFEVVFFSRVLRLFKFFTTFVVWQW